MISSPLYVLGFDTVIVNSNTYNSDSVKDLFEFFPRYGIRNFIFLFDFDFKIHSLSLQKEKIKYFISNVKPPRGIHVKACFNLLLDRSSTLNDDILRIRANKSNGALFVTLPQLDIDNYDVYAKDINKLLYDNKLCPIFVDFDKSSTLIDRDIWRKLFLHKNAAFTFDINYLLDPNNHSLIKEILNNDIQVLPMISSHASKYAGLEQDIKFYIESIDKQTYNKLSFKLEKTSTRIF